MSLALKEERDALVAEYQAIADKALSGKLSDAEEARTVELDELIADVDKRWDMRDKAAEMRSKRDTAEFVTEDGEQISKRDIAKADADKGEIRAKRVSVNEAPTYAEKGTRSWFSDLRSWKADENYEARDRIMGFAREERALTSTDANGGYLVPPTWMQDKFVELRAKKAITANLVSNVDLPAHTDEINLPTMDGPTAVALATENSALQETFATFNTVQAKVFRAGGKQSIPNTLIDRSIPAIDMIIMKDLAKRLALQVNTWVLAGAGSTEPTGLTVQASINAETYTAGTATPQGLFAKLVLLATDIAVNFYERPDAYVMHGRRWGWLIAQVDGNNRPFITEYSPMNAPGTIDSSNAEGLVGAIAGVPVYVDNNITTTAGSGTDEDYILCLCREESWLFNGTPKMGVFVETLAGNDQTLVRATQDVAFTAGRYPKSVAKLTGTGLNDVL